MDELVRPFYIFETNEMKKFKDLASKKNVKNCSKTQE